jgi:hypothetical protein
MGDTKLKQQAKSAFLKLKKTLISELQKFFYNTQQQSPYMETSDIRQSSDKNQERTNPEKRTRWNWTKIAFKLKILPTEYLSSCSTEENASRNTSWGSGKRCQTLKDLKNTTFRRINRKFVQNRYKFKKTFKGDNLLQVARAHGAQSLLATAQYCSHLLET